MALNIFEGGRRVLRVIVGLWILGALVAAYVFEPSLSRTYVVLMPGALPGPYKAEYCELDDGRETNYVKTPNGRSVSISLCFKAVKDTEGKPFIPTEYESGRMKGWNQYSPEAKAYMRGIAQRFSAPEWDLEIVDDEYWGERFVQMKPGAIVVVVGIALLYVFAMVVGWILRGFMGIPRGADSRPKSANAEM